MASAAVTPSGPSDGSEWSQVAIYCNNRSNPWYVELVAVEDGEWMAKGDGIEAGVVSWATGDPFQPTRQRHRDAEVYQVKFAAVTEADREHWRSIGLREPVILNATWAVIHKRKIGTIPWWEAYRFSLVGTSDSHMSARVRMRLDPAFLEDSRKSKVQRTLKF